MGAYRDAVRAGVEIARYAAERIEAMDEVELIRAPELSIVLFRRRGWELADYEAWSDRLLRDQTAFVTASAWYGEPVGRLAFLHPSTPTQIADEVLARL